MKRIRRRSRKVMMADLTFKASSGNSCTAAIDVDANRPIGKSVMPGLTWSSTPNSDDLREASAMILACNALLSGVLSHCTD